jgi:hypothetical protein
MYNVLIPAQGSLISDIPAGDGNIEKLFLRCTVVYIHSDELNWSPFAVVVFLPILGFNPRLSITKGEMPSFLQIDYSPWNTNTILYLKVQKREIFEVHDFEFCTFSQLVTLKY